MAIAIEGVPRAPGALALAAAAALILAPPADAAFPGANGRIAYSVQRWRPPPPPPPPPAEPPPGYRNPYDGSPVAVSARIETALPSGRTRRVLHTFSAAEAGLYGDPGLEAAWSPGGRRLAFGQGGRLAMMRGDGTGMHRLPRFSDSDSMPAWSPDGRRLAFSGMRPCLYCRSLYTVRRDGNGLRRIDAYGADWPAWSVRGRIAFLNNDDQYRRIIGPPDGLYSMRSDGSGPRRRLFARPWGLGTEPDWSPDGRRLAFAARGRIFTMDANGHGLRRLTENYPRYSHPAWSPDGRYIALIRSDPTSSDEDGLYVMRSSGRGLRKIVDAASTTSGDGQVLEWEVIGPPSWQPLRPAR